MTTNSTSEIPYLHLILKILAILSKASPQVFNGILLNREPAYE